MLRLLLILAVAQSACLKKDPLFCSEEKPCTDPARPYCDLTGEFPGSDGHGNTCVPNPFNADGGLPDAAPMPDGMVACETRLAFVRPGGLYTVRPDGTGERVVVERSLTGYSVPRWSADASHLTFSAARDPDDELSDHEILRVRADGALLSVLAQADGLDRRPVWSPDATRIAFLSNRDSYPAASRSVHVFGADGTGIMNLFGGVGDNHPSWSPDGSLIAFESPVAGPFQVYVIPSTGGQAINVSSSSFGDSSPTFSPNGDKIAFSRYIAAVQVSHIYVMDVDGSNVTNISPGLSTNAYIPVWSPDGRKVAFGSAGDAFVFHFDTGDLFNLTNDGLSGSSLFGSDLTWSPDSTTVAFTSTRSGGNSELYTVRSDGAGLTRLTFTATEDEATPAWSPCAQ